MELYCLCNTPFAAGTEVAVLSDVPTFAEDGVGSIYVDDPWWGVIPLTRQDYDAATYATFNNWGEIMFDADCSHFRCGTPVWWGKLMSYLNPTASRVLAS